MNIAVLMGGESTEKDISLQTGLAVHSALEKLTYDSKIIELTNELPPLISNLKNIDLVFNALHGGNGENGTIQGLLDCLGIFYTGSGVLASSICMNKHLCKSLTKFFGHKTPNWEKLSRGDKISHFDEFPVIVKPNSQGSTLGLSLVKNYNELNDAIELAFEYDDEILVEKFIDGRELTISIVGKTILPIVEIYPVHELYDYECKYLKGNSSYLCSPELPGNVSEVIKGIAKDIYDKLGCANYGRIDFRLDKNNVPWFLEVNTLPGMTNTSLVPMAAKKKGWTFPKLIEKIISEVRPL